MFFNLSGFAQFTENKVKSLYIYNLAKYIIWQNEDSIETFKVGVLNDKDMYNNLVKKSKTTRIKKRESEVILYKKLKEVKDVQILYVGAKRSNDMEDILTFFSGKNTLIISDSCDSNESIMINFLSLNQGGKQYEINKGNIEKAGFKVMPRLLIFGGTEKDLRQIYASIEHELEDEQNKVEAQKQKIAKQQESIDIQKKEIKKQKRDIEIQEKEILKQVEQIKTQKIKLKSLLDEVKEQQIKLEQRKKILDEQREEIKIQEENIKSQKKEMEIRNHSLEKQKSELKNLDGKITSQKNKLSEQLERIETQNLVLIAFIVFLTIVLILIFVIFRGYKKKQAINKELANKNAAISQQNIEISQQKEEIMAQSEQLSFTNIELEKLSIVASKTDNAVIITDSEGNFEWINESFTRLFGYTLKQMINEKSANIIGSLTPPHIQKKIKQCFLTKETIYYEYLTKTRDKQEIWVQVTLTPILDKDNNITKLIAIDSDISKIKEAEAEIYEQKNQIEGAYKNIQLLSDFGQKITATLNLQDINNMIYEYIHNLMDTSAFGIGVYKPRRNLVEYKQFMEKEQKLPPFTISMEQINSMSVYCMKNKEEIFINDYEKEYTKYISVQSEVRTTEIPASVIYLPLVAENKLIGVITVQSYEKNAYSKNDLNIVQTLASYISISLDNAHAYSIVNMQNENIRGSIRYAKTIQQAILPIKRNMDKVFNSFVIFKPKDIVSGDFYWFARVKPEDRDIEKVFIAAVDCTGHGVPGAFMSMIGNRILTEIVTEKKIYKPNEMLELLNKGIVSALKQRVTDNKDGMDICLCCIEKLNGAIEDTHESQFRITFSGAKRPLFYCKYNTNEIKTFTGDRASIGGIKPRRTVISFTNKEEIFETNDLLYLTSDGIIDQPGNHRKRFGSKRFKQVLSQVAKLPLEEQKQIIEGELKKYQGEEEQRDDITVIGIRL